MHSHAGWDVQPAGTVYCLTHGALAILHQQNIAGMMMML